VAAEIGLGDVVAERVRLLDQLLRVGVGGGGGPAAERAMPDGGEGAAPGIGDGRDVAAEGDDFVTRPCMS
jgi:hypothetical protein